MVEPTKRTMAFLKAYLNKRSSRFETPEEYIKGDDWIEFPTRSIERILSRYDILMGYSDEPYNDKEEWEDGLEDDE